MSTSQHEEIAQRAYELYMQRGTVDGTAVGDWLRAEAELNTKSETQKEATDPVKNQKPFTESEKASVANARTSGAI